MNKITVAAVGWLLMLECYAETPEERLQVEVELGVLVTSGNTDSSAVSSRLDVKQDLTHWRNNYIAQGLYKEDETTQTIGDDVVSESQVTAERYFLSIQTDYKLDADYRGLFLFGSYEQDQFSGYEYQSALAAGYSDRLFKTPSSYLDYSIGPGYSFSRTDETIDGAGNFVDNQSEESAILRVSAFYQYDFSENAKFTQSLASDAALESGANTKSKSVSAVTANLNDSFALKASLTITHNSEVPAARENTDTITAVTLVYSSGLM